MYEISFPRFSYSSRNQKVYLSNSNSSDGTQIKFNKITEEFKLLEKSFNEQQEVSEPQKLHKSESQKEFKDT